MVGWVQKQISNSCKARPTPSLHFVRLLVLLLAVLAFVGASFRVAFTFLQLSGNELKLGNNRRQFL